MPTELQHITLALVLTLIPTLIPCLMFWTFFPFCSFSSIVSVGRFPGCPISSDPDVIGVSHPTILDQFMPLESQDITLAIVRTLLPTLILGLTPGNFIFCRFLSVSVGRTPGSPMPRCPDVVGVSHPTMLHHCMPLQIQHESYPYTHPLCPGKLVHLPIHRPDIAACFAIHVAPG